jgi:hypothetical protein
MTNSGNPEDQWQKHSLTGGIIVLGIGVFFLLANLEVIPPVHKTWPIFLIVVGIALIVAKLRRPKL